MNTKTRGCCGLKSLSHSRIYGKPYFFELCVLASFWFVLLLAPFTRALALSIAGLVLFFTLLYLIVYPTSTCQRLQMLMVKEKIPITLITFAFLFASGWYFSRYHFVPFWDNAGYWASTLQFNDDLYSQPVRTVVNAIKSVNYSDYNQLLCWVMSFPLLLFKSWESAFFIELVIVTIPTALLAAAFIYSKIDEIKTQSFNLLETPFSLIYAVCLLLGIFLRPVFVGYLDGVAELLFYCLVVALFDSELYKRRWSAIWIGFGVAGTFLLRRWFVFGVIGLAAATIVFWLVRTLTTEKNKFVDLLIVAITITVSMLTPLLLLFRGFIRISMFGNQSTAYTSWTSYYSYAEKFINTCSSIGWLWLVISWISLVFLIVLTVKHKEKGFYSSLELIAASYIGAIVTLMAFWRIQDLTPQHWYAVVPFINNLLFLALFIDVALVTNYVYRRSIKIFISVVAVVCLLSSAELLICHKTINDILGPPIIGPIEQDDISEKKRLVKYLERQSNDAYTVYIAGASPDFNSSFLQYAMNPFGASQLSFNVASSDVDSRDGFNPAFFEAEYVVTSTPVSLHMTPDKEQVVVTLNKLVRDQSSYIGRHYEKKESFRFDDNCKVTVYKRISSFSRKDVELLRDHFQRIYPHSNELFKDRFEQVLKNM